MPLTIMAQTSSWLGTCGHAEVFFLTKVLGSGVPPVVGLVARRSHVRATRMLQGRGHLRPKQNLRKLSDPSAVAVWLLSASSAFRFRSDSAQIPLRFRSDSV